jgi:flagellar hook-associated protein 1 FlgK
MSLTQALATATSGLRAAQAGLSITSANVANADTPGYIRKVPVQVAISAGALGVSVRVGAVNRELDQYIQRQLRLESSGATYATTRAQYYDRLQDIYGVPGSESTLESAYNDFLSALHGLATSPDQAASRGAVLHSGQVLAQQLNTMSTDVQNLRGEAEFGLADSVTRANDAMQHIAELNRQLASASANDGTTANLLDQRDRYIDTLAQLMDVKVVQNDRNQITIFTNSGIQLVGLDASTMVFKDQGTVSAASRWSADPSQRTLGTIVVRGPNGGDIDLVATGAIRSGQIAALLQMRDDTLVQAQTQLDEVAAGLARALSDRTVAGTPAGAVPQTGYDIDLNGMLAGNSVKVTYTDNLTGTQRTLTLVRVDDPAALPLSNNDTSDPNDTVVGLDFSGGAATVATQLNAALGATGLQFSSPGANTLRILDDGATDRVNVDAVSATVTTTSVANGVTELPFFLDANAPYTGAFHEFETQTVGFAGRIAVNASLLADPSKLVVYQLSPLTPSGDQTRPKFLYDKLSSGLLTFSPDSGIGSAASPFNGTLQGFMRQVISQQGEQAEAAANLKQGQDVVFNTLQQRFNDASGVNIDQEMANLLNLQNAYAANARVLSTIKDMIETLLRM